MRSYAKTYDTEGLRRIPMFLVFLASAYVVAVVGVSALPGWNVAVIAVAAIYVIVHMFCLLGKKIRAVKPDAVFFLFIAWSLLGLIGGYATVTPLTLFGKLWTMLQLICLSFFLYSLSVDVKSIRWLEWSYLGGVLTSLLWILASTGGHFGAERIAGTLGNANALAFVLLCACAISMDLFRNHQSRLLKGALLLNIGFIIPFLLATGSRKGILGLVLLLCLAVMLDVFLRERGKRFRALIGAMLALFLAFALLFPLIVASPHFGRIINLERFIKGQSLVEQEESLSGRAGLFKLGTQLALRHPFFGVGLDQFRFYDNKLKLTEIEHPYSHSNVIEVLADTGYLGFLVYHCAYFYILVRLIFLWKRRHIITEVSYIFMIVMILSILIIYDLFSVTYYTKSYWLALTIILSLLTLAEDKYKHSRSTQGIDDGKSAPSPGSQSQMDSSSCFGTFAGEKKMGNP